jgi:hypothetical protein
MRADRPPGRRLVSGAMSMLHLGSRRLEESEQRALLRWAELVQVGECTLQEILVHVPNGGGRSKAEGGILKAMGVKAGIPDLLLPMRTSAYGAGWWELKVGNNKPTAEQLTWHTRLRSLGHYVQTYWHWHEAANDILRYLERGPYTVIVRAKP